MVPVRFRIVLRSMARRALPVVVLAPLSSNHSSVGVAQVRPATEIVLHVDRGRAGASDSNAGTASAPLRSIREAVRRALDNARADRNTRILVHPGTYRELIALDGSRVTRDAAIVLEGTDEGAVFVSGSDEWRQWQREGETPLFRHAWPFNWDPPPLPRGWDQVRSRIEQHPILLRGEMIFVNGRRFEQVFSRKELQARPGTFYVQVDARRQLEGVVWVHALEDLTSESVSVEVSVRPALLIASGLQHVTLRRLVFQHASSRLQDAAVRVDRSSNVLVDACRFTQNSWIGLGVHQSSDVSLQRVNASANGAGGVQAWRVRGLTLTDTEASSNNWRGALGDFTGWATGQKFVSVHGGRFIRYKAVGNQATGLWFDTDNSDILVEDAVICDNATRGVFLEASQGPFVITGSRICHNEVGLMATGAARVTLRENTITDNADHQVVLPWLVGAHAETSAVDFETGQSRRIRSEHWTLTGNVIGGHPDSLLFSVGRWPWFFETFRSDLNRWQHAGRADRFAVYPARGAGAERLNLDGWRKVSGQDRSSVFSYP